MSIPAGHRIDREFVCMSCLRDDDHRPGGIDGRGSAVDHRMGSGRECSRCGRRMPYLATVRLLPDGCSSISAPAHWRPEKTIRVDRDESVLIDCHALVYVSMAGGGPEVGLRVTPSGTVEVWVHDDPYGDGENPSAQWTHERKKADRG